MLPPYLSTCPSFSPSPRAPPFSTLCYGRPVFRRFNGCKTFVQVGGVLGRRPLGLSIFPQTWGQIGWVAGQQKWEKFSGRLGICRKQCHAIGGTDCVVIVGRPKISGKELGSPTVWPSEAFFFSVIRHRGLHHVKTWH